MELDAAGVARCIDEVGLGFMYAPVFHPEKRYAVQEADRASDCGSARPLP